MEELLNRVAGGLKNDDIEKYTRHVLGPGGGTRRNNWIYSLIKGVLEMVQEMYPEPTSAMASAMCSDILFFSMNEACCETYAQRIEASVLDNELSDPIQQLLRDTIALYRIIS